MNEKLEAITINADDLVTLLMHVLIETVGVLRPMGADQALTDLANRLDDVARQTKATNERLSLVVGALAANLMGTEEAP